MSKILQPYWKAGRKPMTKKTVEIDACYNDYFIEVHTVGRQEMKYIIPNLLDDERKSFDLGEKTFSKKI